MKPDKIYLSLGLLLLLATVSWISSCTHEAKIADFPEICFEVEILPIFLNSCAISNCHDGGHDEPDLVLDNYNDIIREIVPGNPANSKIYKAITATSGEDKMPPDQPLSLDNRTLIRVWIEQGAKETLCPANLVPGKKVSFLKHQ